MVIEKKRNVGAGIFIVIFIALLLTLPFTSGFIANAVSVRENQNFYPMARKGESKLQNDAHQRSQGTTRISKKDVLTKQQGEDENAVAKKTQQQVNLLPASTASREDMSTKNNVNEVPSAPQIATDDETIVIASAQAVKPVKPVVYESEKIDSDHRNELLYVSMIGMAVSGVMYALTYAAVLWRMFYGEPISIRRQITGQNEQYIKG